MGHSEQASWKQEGPGDGRRDKFVEKNRRNLKAGIREKIACGHCPKILSMLGAARLIFSSLP